MRPLVAEPRGHPPEAGSGPFDVFSDRGHLVITGDDLNAVAAFPELQRLIDLRGATWTWLPSTRDGDLVEIRGVLAWPGGWADALRLRFTTDAMALRTDRTGGVVWSVEGTLVDVLDGLAALPAPFERGAPRLVTGSAPTLWTP